jgi:hydrophobic/amphiphilic exporter-1 (mainly G- bacteria), HAE1 family
MIRYFAEHPTAANLLMLLLLLLGISAVFQIRRETMPEHSKYQVQITANYPGATSDEVEEAVCQKIEDAVETVNNIKEMTSEAKEGLGTVTVEMEDSGNFQQFQNDIKTEVEAIDNFPDLVEKPIIKPLNRTDQVVSIAITGPMSPVNLKAYCEDIKEKIKRLPNVNQVVLEGFSQHQFKVEISPKTLLSYGLKINDIATTVKQQNTNLPAGTLKTTERDYMIRFNDRKKTVNNLENMIIIGGQTGAEIKLGDIAKISDDFELDEDKVLFNGERAGLLKISKAKSKDALTIFDEVKTFLQHEENIKPPGVNFYITNNVSSIVKDRLMLLTSNGIQGIVLVFLALWLFLSFRFSFWVSMGLPVSFLGALFFMKLMNISINMISMVALLIAIGLLMDDAIVISENIASHMARGKKALNATVDGIKEVATGVISSFLTTVFVFGSLATITGTMGKILRVIPIVLIIVLIVSLIEAFFILPNHLAHSFKNKSFNSSKNKIRKKLNNRIEWIKLNLVAKFMNIILPYRYLFIGCLIAVFILSIGMISGGILKFRVFPDLDGDTIVARVLLPQGTPLSKTENIVKNITNALNKVNEHFTPEQPDKNELIQNISVQYNTNTDAGESGAHVVTISADLLPGDNRVSSVNDILAYWRKETGNIPEVMSLTFKDFQPGPAGVPIDIRIKGKDLNELKAVSLQLQQHLKTYKGIHDITDNMRLGKPELILSLKPGAMKEGLTSKAIADQLRAAYHGQVADEIQVGPESYEIVLKLTDMGMDNIKRFDNFYIRLDNGKQVPLSAVTTIKVGRGFAKIYRKDGIRNVAVKAEIDRSKANINEIINDLRNNYAPKLIEAHPDIWIDYEGESKKGAKTGRSMVQAFLFGIFGIFILLSFQFKSYIEPLIVMAAIPLAIIGVIWGHIILGITFCMPSAIGFISLAGIVVNDSILLMEFIKIKSKEGLNIKAAAIEASKARFRPVLLTSITTIAGLLPLMTERSMQAQILIPLAVSIVFGLAASTFLVLFVVPTLYIIYDDFFKK